MSDTETTPPASPQPRYAIEAGEGIVAGVAAGLSATTGIDVVIIRIVFVVTALLHGAGALAYAAAYLAMPSMDDVRASRAPRYHRARLVAAAGLGAIAVLILVAPFDLGTSVTVALLLVGIGVALWRASPTRRFLPPRSASAHVVAPAEPPPAPSPPRPLFGVGSVAVGAMLVAEGAALGLGRLGAVQLTSGKAAALALVILGAGLIASAVIGPTPWWLALATVLLLVITPVLSTLDRAGLDIFRPAGSEWITARTPAEIPDTVRHGIGAVTIDVSDVNLAGVSRTIAVENGLGDVTVYVPATAGVLVNASTGQGEEQIVESNGTIDWDTSTSKGAVEVLGQSGGGQLALHLRTGIGNIYVMRMRPPFAAPPSPAPPPAVTP